ncbi:hypothetical protein [Peribacillus sp. SCS-37]|uniref:hypothetical protein n=1 Tax=Paraperibacillus esterisolvens TaxID=3115296 RepID=UPI003905D3D8
MKEKSQPGLSRLAMVKAGGLPWHARKMQIECCLEIYRSVSSNHSRSFLPCS